MVMSLNLGFGFRGSSSQITMCGFGTKLRVAALVVIALWIALAGLYHLLKPISNGCIMTYMYPTYIPISTPKNVSLAKYGLYLYHEGWKHIDFNEHLKQLNGVPVLFIPGNGGSYKQASLSNLFFIFRLFSVSIILVFTEKSQNILRMNFTMANNEII